MVIGLTIRVTGLEQVLSSFTFARSRLPMLKREINSDLANHFVKGAKPRIHNITHKTEQSTKIASITEQKAVVESRFGAYYEERRKGTKFGTPHNFLTQQMIATTAEVPRIVTNRLNSIFNF